MTQRPFAVAALLCSCLFAQAIEVPLFSTNATWRFLRGLAEASTPTSAWRSNTFDDVAFSNAPAPFTYGEGYTYGTDLTGMQNNYACFFLRQALVLSNVSQIGALRFGAKVDDGFVLWINGVELRRVNMPGASNDPVTVSSLALGATEPVPFLFYTLDAPANYLVEGTNVVAVQVFNTTSNSSDLVFDASLEALTAESVAPVIATFSPPAGNVTNLTQVSVTFTENVTGVSADDLLVNLVAATGVTGSGSNYTFTFPPPALYGGVNIEWSPNHGIADIALVPNAFDGTAPGGTWQYNYIDVVPPGVTQLLPVPATTVRELGQLRVAFSEGVLGVNAGDLQVNGAPATNVISQAGSIYIFQFPAAAPGSATAQFIGGHGITDLAGNPFAGGSWSYTVDPTFSPGDIVINEINVSPTTGLNDPVGTGGDMDALPWIEILNRGTNTIDLLGWSLSDDSDFPQRWVFPAKTLAPGQYVVVFASGLDITNATGTNRFHTNFKLSRDGEFLGLYSGDAPPQLVSAYDFPEQRNDYSFGIDGSGNLRYFTPPTPGAVNGSSSITGVVSSVHFGVERGFFTQPFDLVLSCPTRGAQIYYTTNGSEPTLNNGFPYLAPIRIAATALIRAGAFRTNQLPSAIRTHSYFFNMSAADRSLPLISLVTDQNNLTGPSGIIGISNVVLQGDGTYLPGPGGYHNPSRHGVAWERPTSIEFIRFPDNSGFQSDGGIRVQGSDYQRPRTTASSKFSFRLYFRGEYGSGRLEYPIFPLSTTTEFDQVVLRAGFNDPSNPFIRDELTRRLSHDMGSVSAHGTLVNVFINGVFKGYYNPTERVHEEALQSQLGGSEEWDVVGPSFATSSGAPGVIDGDRANFQSMVAYINGANSSDPATWAEINRRLDVVNFADYTLLNAYCGMGDWPQNNWRAGKDRAAYGPWRFIVWDAEWTMGYGGRAVSLNMFTLAGAGPNEGGLSSIGDSEIARVYQGLRPSEEFRLLWADRVHKHFFNSGALVDSNITNRFGQMRSEMATVLPGMATDIITTWVPQRRPIFFGQMDAFGLMRSSNAPFFNQFGGKVPPGFLLTMTATNIGGTIYYTTNGADPRVPFTGAVSNAALVYSAAVPITQNVLVKARTLNGTNWSALTEASFQLALLGSPMRFTEVHYNPADSPNYEFFEMMNVGGTPFDLSGASFDGVAFIFPLGSIIQPGARMIMGTSLNPGAFLARYPGAPVFGFYSGALNNGGERLALKDAAGNILASVDYDDANGWPTRADGGGSSLEVVDPLGDPDALANWRASTNNGGSPGSLPAPVSGTVRLSEVFVHNVSNPFPHPSGSGYVYPGYIELEKISPTNLEGWSLTDDANPRKYVFPNDSTYFSGQFVTVWCANTNGVQPQMGFTLNTNGGTVFLYDANTNLVDAISYGRQLADYAIGRVGGVWKLTDPRTNAMNSAAVVGSAANLSINEFLANAPAGLPDWIELFNNSPLPVSLQGTFLASTAAVHQITSLTFLPPYGFMRLFADEGVGPDRLDFKLPAAGGAIILYDSAGTEVNRVTYTAQTEGVTRGRLPDGTANIVNFPGTASPGASNYVNTYSGPVLNEVLARNITAYTNGGRVADFIELYNPNVGSFSLAGYSVSVNSAEVGQWIFPPGTTVPGRGFVLISCDDGLPASTNAPYNIGRALDGESGGVYLFNTAGQLVNFVEYGFQVANKSVGLTNGVWRLLAAPTPGATNTAGHVLGSTNALRFNEWMANPASGPDWFELFNSTNQPVDMSGLFLTDNPSIGGTNGHRIAPLSFIGASNFVQWIADGDPDQGRNHVNFQLDAEGDALRLYAVNASNVLQTVFFGAQPLGVSQGFLPDGATNSVSVFPGSATPGESNYRLITDVVINEVLSHAAPPNEQMIELRNLSGEAVDIGGWFLSDSIANLKKVRFADGTTILPGGIIAVSGTVFGTPPNTFVLDRARGGELWLSAADGADLTGLRTRVKFGAADVGISFGRHLVAGRSDFVAQSAHTPFAANSGPLVGPIVINEIMYHPVEGPVGATEFIELRNITATNVNLFDSTNSWRISGGIDFVFPPSVTLAPGESLLVVDFDPAALPGTFGAFQAQYGVSPSVQVYGPYLGQLNNGGEDLELSKPSLPDGSFIPYVLVDKVNYSDSAPWPSGAVDGGGHSLQRRNSAGYGNDAANWLAAAPTAGGANASGLVAPPTITQSPANANVFADSDVLLQAAAAGPTPIEWQWRFNGAELPGATNASLFLEALRSEESGLYDVYARNAGGSAFSDAAQITVVQPAFIANPPTPYYATNGGSNATFSVVAGGTPPFQYQWRFNDNDIPGATAPSLSLSNLVIDQSGIYTVAVSNNYGSATASVTLVVLIVPVVTNHIQPVTVLQGGTATFSLVAGPNHPFAPLWYRWIRGGSAFATTSVPVLVLTNVQSNGLYRVVVTNAARPSGVASPSSGSVTLTVLPDFDGDGISDWWETNYFGNVGTTNNAGNAFLDPDGDGMSNRDEYLAGTNPTNALSLLKIILSDTNASELTFVAQTNLSYAVQWRTNMLAPPWTNLTSIIASPQVRTIRVDSANAPSGPERYFRIITPASP